MTARPGTALLRHIRHLVTGREIASPDNDLVQNYLENRDEAAFAALVERHGPMVLGVCRSVLRNHSDAEDAFQATFLVLARKARSIRRRDSLASWLHGVALRLARKAQAATFRRQTLEAKAPLPASGPMADELSWSEVRAILHAELAALPERFRAPLVLCYLEGLSQDEAARRLDWTAATVKGRLQRGRERLRRRLERRGLGSASALGATLLAEQTLAAMVSPQLAQTAVQVACAAAGETASGAVGALARCYLAPLVPARFLVMGTVLILAAAMVGGATLLARKPSDNESPATKLAAPPQEARLDRFGDPLPDGAVARLGTVRFNHGHGFQALYFSPDGKTIISQGSELVRQWDASTGKELASFVTPKTSWDEQTALKPDGNTLVSLSQDSSSDILRTWDLKLGKQVSESRLAGHRYELSAFRRNAISNDVRLGALHRPESIQVFDLESAKQLCLLPKLPNDVRCMTFAGTNQLVTADKDQRIDIWDARSGKSIREFHHGSPVGFLAASEDGRLLATLEHHTGAIDRYLEKDAAHIWDLTTGTRKHTLHAPPNSWYMNVRFSPCGKLLYTRSIHQSDGEECAVWDLDAGQRLPDTAGPPGIPLAFSPDGSRITYGGAKFDLWDAKNRRRLPITDNQSASYWVLFSSAENRVLTMGTTSMSAWDAASGRHLRSFQLPPYFNIQPRRSYSADGRYVLSFTGDSEHTRILIFDVATGKRLHTLSPPGATQWTDCVFSPDSSLLVTRIPGKETLIRLWDVQTGKEVRSFADSKAGLPGKLFFDGNGKTLFVVSRTVVGYEIATGKKLFSWKLKVPKSESGARKSSKGGASGEEHEEYPWSAVAVSPDGSFVAVILSGGGSRLNERIMLCDAKTGKLIRRWSDSGIPSQLLEEVRFSPDGRLLATSDLSDVHLWDVATGKEVRTMRGHRGVIRSLAFSVSGRQLASAGGDSTVLIWDVPK